MTDGSGAGRRFTDQAGEIETVIAEGTHIRGELTGKASVELSGSVDGTVRIEGLFWARQSGRVQGEVYAKDVVVEGEVDGKITARDKVELRSTCQSRGNIVTDTVAIAEGSFFEGHIQMRGEGKKGNGSTSFQEKRKPV